MEIITTKDGKILAYDNGKVTIIDKKQLLMEKEDLNERIALDVMPDDAKLLEWAKGNYPVVDHSQEVKRLDEINNILEKIDG